jgi:hypothetical protein
MRLAVGVSHLSVLPLYGLSRLLTGHGQERYSKGRSTRRTASRRIGYSSGRGRQSFPSPARPREANPRVKIHMTDAAHLAALIAGTPPPKIATPKRAEQPAKPSLLERVFGTKPESE